jgi:hypothetical protein
LERDWDAFTPWLWPSLRPLALDLWLRVELRSTGQPRAAVPTLQMFSRWHVSPTCVCSQLAGDEA